MKRPIIKHFSNGVKATFECDDAKKRKAFEKELRKALKRAGVGCNEDPIVTTFEAPLPTCGPDEAC